ncbi:cation-dependent mannose-6-phosphate receptor-like [Amphiura filiformis]|uniref:cation-dependent mannose-6-phosphate receptor-like n=1 Tax=Amphiura filiformis TaxID=82378 RepID=UPI003B20CB9B
MIIINPIRFGYQESVDGNPEWEYAANVCFGFNDHECINQVICQRSTAEPIKYFPIGNADSATWNSAGTEITYTETYEDVPRTSVLTLECDINGKQNNPTLTREGEQMQKYHFTLKSICACANGCKNGNDGSGSLSVGSILCIIFSALVVIYLISGVLFMKLARGAEGKEIIPNVELWMNLPGYIKDGCFFLIHGCKSSTTYEAI